MLISWHIYSYWKAINVDRRHMNVTWIPYASKWRLNENSQLTERFILNPNVLIPLCIYSYKQAAGGFSMTTSTCESIGAAWNDNGRYRVTKLRNCLSTTVGISCLSCISVACVTENCNARRCRSLDSKLVQKSEPWNTLSFFTRKRFIKKFS